MCLVGSETSALRNAGGHVFECYGALQGGGGVKIVNFCLSVTVRYEGGEGVKIVNFCVTCF